MMNINGLSCPYCIFTYLFDLLVRLAEYLFHLEVVKCLYLEY
jgi:hypothetical protein